MALSVVGVDKKRPEYFPSLFGGKYSGLILVRLYSFRDIVDQLLGFLPAQTWICYGFSVYMFTDLLTSRLQIALDHNALYKVMDIRGVAAAVQYLFYDTDLLLVTLIGIGMVGIYDAGRIGQLPLPI